MRSRSIASMAANGSNCSCNMTLAPAWNAGNVRILSPPTWNNGSVVSTRSALVRSCMCALLSAFQNSAFCVSTTPFGTPVDPDV